MISVIMVAEPAGKYSTDGGGNNDAALVVVVALVNERLTVVAAMPMAGGISGASTERARARKFGWFDV